MPSKILQALAWVAYPLVIFFGLQFFEPRYVAALLGLLLLVRRRSMAGKLLAGLSKIDRGVIAALLAIAGLAALTNSEGLLRYYPCAVSLGMLSLFAMSLRNPPTMIERFARLQQPELSPEGVRYTRTVTKVWCGFFIVNGLLAAWTAAQASREIWMLYNGLIAYLLMGALFAGEWLVRRGVMKQHA